MFISSFANFLLLNLWTNSWPQRIGTTSKWRRHERGVFQGGVFQGVIENVF